MSAQPSFRGGRHSAKKVPPHQPDRAAAAAEHPAGLGGARCDQIERLTEGFGFRVVGPCLNPIAHAPAASGL